VGLGYINNDEALGVVVPRVEAWKFILKRFPELNGSEVI
jgi:hypothetical protein